MLGTVIMVLGSTSKQHGERALPRRALAAGADDRVVGQEGVGRAWLAPASRGPTI